jgi:Fe-S-cluster containining protein
VSSELISIHEKVDRRVSDILSSRGDWLCKKGCDHCCRRLATVPSLTEPEWELLRRAFDALSAQERSDVIARVERLRNASGPVVCPFLNLEERACMVYSSRPIACRTYGFFVERDGGLYCGMIQERVEDGEYSDVVWGNNAAIESALAALGPARNLIEWFTNGLFCPRY